jgi:glycosyltransferase involved in cell wall biosynthesis
MDQERLRVLALVPYPTGLAPGQRYRIEQWAPHLRDDGVDIDFASFADRRLAEMLYEPGRYLSKAWHMWRAYLRRLRTCWSAARYDVVYLHREAALIGPALLERVVSARNPRLVYDFDDAIWLPYVSPRNRYLSYLKAPRKTSSICRLASEITVGNDVLAAYARRYNPAVTVVPSTVSCREYLPRPGLTRPGPTTIGWTGSHSSAQYLRVVEGALKKLARERSLRLLVIGVDDYRLEGVDVECRPWKAETEVADLWDMAIGIMPLSDDPWARGKCAMKAIQYMGVALPAVVSPIGANADVVEDGVTGFHAVGEAGWICALRHLIDSEELRCRMGTLGRARVKSAYSAEVHAPRVARLLAGTAE